MAINPTKSISGSEMLHRRDYANIDQELELEKEGQDQDLDFVTSAMSLQEYRDSGQQFQRFAERYKHKINFLKSKIQYRLPISDDAKSVLFTQFDEYLRRAFDDGKSQFKHFSDQQLEEYVYSGMYQKVTEFSEVVNELAGTVSVDDILMAMILFTPESGADPALQQFFMDQAIELLKQRHDLALQLPKHQAKVAKEGVKNPVFMAIALNKFKMAYLMLQAQEGLSAEDTNFHGQNALHIAAHRGQVGLASQLMAMKTPRFNPQAKDNYGNHALHLAAASGSPKMTAAMVNAVGAQAFKGNNAGKTPVHIAAELKNNDALAALIINATPEDLDAQDQNGNTAAHIAVQMNNPNGTSQLLKAGANPQVTNRAGQSVGALMMNMVGLVSSKL